MSLSAFSQNVASYNHHIITLNNITVDNYTLSNILGFLSYLDCKSIERVSHDFKSYTDNRKLCNHFLCNDVLSLIFEFVDFSYFENLFRLSNVSVQFARMAFYQVRSNNIVYRDSFEHFFRFQVCISRSNYDKMIDDADALTDAYYNYEIEYHIFCDNYNLTYEDLETLLPVKYDSDSDFEDYDIDDHHFDDDRYDD